MQVSNLYWSSNKNCVNYDLTELLLSVYELHKLPLLFYGNKIVKELICLTAVGFLNCTVYELLHYTILVPRYKSV